MWLILPLVLLYGLKFAEVKFMENVSWWWINGAAFLVFLWFEFFERMLGLDNKQSEMHFEQMQEARKKRAFGERLAGRARRKR